MLSSITQPTSSDKLCLVCAEFRQKPLDNATRKKAALLMARADDLQYSRWDDRFINYRNLLEMGMIDSALVYSNPDLRNGPYEAVYLALCLNLKGRYADAEYILSEPTVGDYRLPLRVFNARMLGAATRSALAKDLNDRTHDPVALCRVAYNLSADEPQLARIAIENALAQARNGSFYSNLPSAYLLTASLTHLGRLEHAADFAQRTLAMKPQSTAVSSAQEVMLHLEYARVLRLQKRSTQALSVLQTLLTAIKPSMAMSEQFEAIVLAELATIQRDQGNLTDACDLFEAALVKTKDNPNVSVIDKVLVTETFAKLCSQMRKTERSAQLRKASELLLPARCRAPFTSWMPLCPDYRGLRTIADIE